MAPCCIIAMCCAYSCNFCPNSAFPVLASLKLPRRSPFCLAPIPYAWLSCATKLRASSRICSTARRSSRRESRSAFSTHVSPEKNASAQATFLRILSSWSSCISRLMLKQSGGLVGGLALLTGKFIHLPPKLPLPIRSGVAHASDILSYALIVLLSIP